METRKQVWKVLVYFRFSNDRGDNEYKSGEHSLKFKNKCYKTSFFLRNGDLFFFLLLGPAYPNVFETDKAMGTVSDDLTFAATSTGAVPRAVPYVNVGEGVTVAGGEK